MTTYAILIANLQKIQYALKTDTFNSKNHSKNLFLADVITCL